MAKFKKITTKYMCMLSAVLMFLSALFYPLESFKAEVLVPSYENTLSFNFYYNESDIMAEDSLLPLPPTDLDIEVNVGDSVQIDDYQYFYYTPKVRQLFTTNSSIYAYKILIDSYEVSVNTSSCWHSKNVYIGSEDDICSMSGVYGNVIDQDTVCWYVSDFSHGIPIYFTHLYLLYEYSYSDSLLGTYNFNYPSISFNGNYTVSIVGYSVDDLTDEIYATLQNIYSNDQQVLTALLNIYYSNDTVENKLQSLVSFAESQLAYLMEIKVNTDQIESLLGVSNQYLSNIQNELEEQTTWLERIWNTLVDYFDTSNSQQDKVDDFANNSSQQSGSLDNLVNDMGQLEKPTIDGSANYIDEFIPSGDSFVMDSLGVVMDFPLVGKCVLLTCSMAFVAYVLFGKR